MNKFLRTVSVLAVAVGLSACNAHTSGFNNQTGGTIVGGITGAVVGNQFGKGTGKTAATALGAVIGAVTGSSVGRSMDRPAGQTVIIREPRQHGRHYHGRVKSGSCSQYYDRGERAACLRGVQRRIEAEQRKREREAFDRARGCPSNWNRDECFYWDNHPHAQNIRPPRR